MQTWGNKACPEPGFHHHSPSEASSKDYTLHVAAEFILKWKMDLVPAISLMP